MINVRKNLVMLYNIFPSVICNIILEYSKLSILVLTENGFLYQLINSKWKFLFKINLKNAFENYFFKTNDLHIFNDKMIHTFDYNNLDKAETHKLFSMNKLLNNWKDFQIVHIGTDIFFIGGKTTGFFTGRCATDRVYKFNTIDNSWKKMACMKYARTDHNVVVLNDRIYAIGGDDGAYAKHITRKIEYYDIRKNKWFQIKKMPRKLYKNKAVVYDNKIYTFGCTGNQGWRYNWLSVEKYDPDLDEWTDCCTIDSFSWYYAVVTCGIYIYFIDNYPAHESYPKIHSKIRIFNPINNEFNNITLETPAFGDCKAIVV